MIHHAPPTAPTSLLARNGTSYLEQKSMGNEHGRLGEPTPAGIQSMDENLQKKFAKGIQYNSK